MSFNSSIFKRIYHVSYFSVANHNTDDEEDDEQFDQDDDSSVSSSFPDGEDDESDSLSSIQMHDITTLMEKCRTVIATIRKSSILYEFIHTLAIDLSINAGLIVDMRVRWNSSYKMLFITDLYTMLP